jgi:hypothetical protein
MGLVIGPLALILHAAGESGPAPAVPLVQAPVALVDVAVGAGVHALAMAHVAQRLALQQLHASHRALSIKGCSGASFITT